MLQDLRALLPTLGRHKNGLGSLGTVCKLFLFILFMSGEHAKVCEAQHIQLSGSCKPIRRFRHHSLIVLYVVPIRQLLCTYHSLGPTAR